MNGFKVWLKQREIRGKFSIWAPSIISEFMADDELKARLRFALDSVISAEIKKHIEYEIDYEICRKIAKEMIDAYDLKAGIGEIVSESFKNYLSQTFGYRK